MTVSEPVKALLVWEGRTIRLAYHPLKWGVIDHLEFRVDHNEPIPISETGYRSHFFDPISPALTTEEVKDMARNWLDKEAKSDAWIETEASRRQLTLF